jgi:hypothetical protein
MPGTGISCFFWRRGGTWPPLEVHPMILPGFALICDRVIIDLPGYRKLGRSPENSYD